MQPPPCASIRGMAARMPRHTPERFTSMTRAQSSAASSPADPGTATAALLTSTSIRP
jgi:hypothetical protein